MNLDYLTQCCIVLTEVVVVRWKEAIQRAMNA